MKKFGSTYPQVRDSAGVLAGTCPNSSRHIAPGAPAFVLTVNNPPSVDLWEDEPIVGGIIQEENGEGLILE